MKLRDIVRKKKTKVFCIGLSRTGTHSLGIALAMLGYRTRHFPVEILKYNNGLTVNMSPLKSHEAFLDTPIARTYKQLDQAFPGSKFILTIREIDSWLESCRKFFLSQTEKVDNPYYRTIGLLHQDLYGGNVFERDRFKKAYETHVQEVHRYFKGREKDLLIMDVCGGEGWDSLCHYLDKPLIGSPFPQKGVRSNLNI